MSKEIDNIEFWKTRIKTATQEHCSVYCTTLDGWKYIEDHHKHFVGEHLTGKVLDAGCGYGRLSEWIDDYTGIDFSPDFIERAKSKYPDKRFQVADLRALPFEDKEFDWAVCASVRGMIVGNLGNEEWAKMEKELKRVAKQILFMEYTNPDQYEII